MTAVTPGFYTDFAFTEMGDGSTMLHCQVSLPMVDSNYHIKFKRCIVRFVLRTTVRSRRSSRSGFRR